MKKLSIIVPVYNIEKYLEKCVDSILNQTLQDFELILIDDGSLDNSGKICDELSKRDGRIKVIHKTNGGSASARNAGLLVMTGEYVGFVDSDDYVEEDMFETMINACENNQCEAAFCDRYLVDEGGEFLPENSKVSKYKELTVLSQKEALTNMFLATGMTFAVWDKVFKRELFDDVKFPEGCPAEDVPCSFDTIKKAKNVVHIGKQKYYYRALNTSVTHGKFNEKTMGYSRYVKKIREEVYVEIPELRDAIDYCYIQALSSTYAKLNQSKNSSEYKYEERKLRKELRGCRKETKRNSYLGRNSKIAAFLIRNGCYGIIRVLYQKRKC